MKVLVTGGAGYIGSTTCLALERAGHTPVVLDSLLSGPRAFVGDRVFYEGDCRDRALLRRVFADHPDIGCTIHMAARIVVPESVAEPYAYYRDNVVASLELFDELTAIARESGTPGDSGDSGGGPGDGTARVVFSSSASVYDVVEGFGVDESAPLAPGSPYARTKRVMEMALEDMAAATGLRAMLLRYFNPIGSDPDLTTGVYVREPSHVLGQLMLAATGQIEAFTLTGTDLPTRDGTGLRDYVHVWDLARAHVAAVQRFDGALDAAGRPSVAVNLGTGAGVTVRELVAAFTDVTGRDVPLREAPPRPGDAVGAFALVDRASELLGWRAELDVREGIASALRWFERREQVLGYR